MLSSVMHKHKRTYKAWKEKNRIRYPKWRYAALIRDNFTCQDCGAKIEDRRVSVHHLDENGPHSTTFNGKPNNSLDNLITLCPSCHMKRHMVKMRVNPNIQIMVELRRQKWSYQMIANEFDISRQRVYQIVKKAAPELIAVE